tara:strand:- start:861 stop:1172 length:312 start_codon:yes stop_codon:yes gene_type:complete
MERDHDAIRKAYPNVISITDNTYDADGHVVVIDQAQVDAARVELDTEIAATLYQRQRTGKAGTTDTIYASIGDQLDMQYKDAINGTTTWKDHIAAVKAKYPKP